MEPKAGEFYADNTGGRPYPVPDGRVLGVHFITYKTDERRVESKRRDFREDERLWRRRFPGLPEQEG